MAHSLFIFQLSFTVLDKTFVDFFLILAQFIFTINETEVDHYHQKVSVEVA